MPIETLSFSEGINLLERDRERARDRLASATHAFNTDASEAAVIEELLEAEEEFVDIMLTLRSAYQDCRVLYSNAKRRR